MKLILTREVAGLGTAGDVVTVKDGYARNFPSLTTRQSLGQRVARSRSKAFVVLVQLAKFSLSITPRRSRRSSKQLRLL